MNARKIPRLYFHRERWTQNFGFCIFKDSRDGNFWLDISLIWWDISLLLFKAHNRKKSKGTSETMAKQHQNEETNEQPLNAEGQQTAGAIAEEKTEDQGGQPNDQQE